MSNLPHKQAFNINGTKNKTKTKAWWQLGKSHKKGQGSGNK